MEERRESEGEKVKGHQGGTAKRGKQMFIVVGG